MPYCCSIQPDWGWIPGRSHRLGEAWKGCLDLVSSSDPRLTLLRRKCDGCYAAMNAGCTASLMLCNADGEDQLCPLRRPDKERKEAADSMRVATIRPEGLITSGAEPEGKQFPETRGYPALPFSGSPLLPWLPLQPGGRNWVFLPNGLLAMEALAAPWDVPSSPWLV